MKQIEVVAAVIIQEGRVFAAQRNGKGEVGFKWEFPGGKTEQGETNQAALARELREELGVVAEVGDFIMTVTHGYQTFHLTMHCYQVEIRSGTLVLKEHLESRWLAPNELDTVDWAPADIPVADRVRELLTL
ncbi:MAG: (deoxy)nucleoside triphosphate pyrophosphohydrolase [Treponemataceae bacterium]